MDGGAVRGCFIGGVLTGFHQAGYDYRYWDRYVGTSIGGTSATYFVTDQIGQGMRFFTHHMPVGFVKKLLGVIPYFDQHYLEHAYRHSDDALSVDTLKRRKQEVWMPLSDPRTGQSEFRCLNREADPPATMLKATHTPMTIPFRRLGDEYFDGGFTCQPPVHQPLLEGATEVWYISSHQMGYRNSWRKELGYKILGSLLGLMHPGVGKLLCNMVGLENAAHEAVEAIPNLKVICPRERLTMSWRCRDITEIKATIEQGRLAAVKFMLENKM